MIRTKDKILAEAIDPNTVVAGLTPPANKWIKGGSGKQLLTHNPGPNRILVTDGNGNISALSFHGQFNKLIGTDENGDIIFIDRGVFL